MDAVASADAGELRRLALVFVSLVAQSPIP